MPWAYVTVNTITGTGALDITGTATDIRLRVLAEAISAQVDRYTNRHFQPVQQVKTFPGPGTSRLLVPDLISITSLKEDTNFDGTFETTWGTGDYILEPQNANPTAYYGGPYQRLVVTDSSTGSQDKFIAGRQMYQIDGTWGYISIKEDSLLDSSGSLGSTATTLTLSGAASGTIEQGHTILVDTEMMYVVGTGTGTIITVVRGVWGSTAGTHASGTAVNVFRYPPAVQQAVLMQVARIWKRKDSAFSNMVGLPGLSEFEMMPGGLDKDVKELLGPYRRYAVGVH